jgi:hypothetical protein
MRVCPNCGGENDDALIACPKCGPAFTTNVEARAPKPTAPAGRRTIRLPWYLGILPAVAMSIYLVPQLWDSLDSGEPPPSCLDVQFLGMTTNLNSGTNQALFTLTNQRGVAVEMWNQGDVEYNHVGPGTPPPMRVALPSVLPARKSVMVALTVPTGLVEWRANFTHIPLDLRYRAVQWVNRLSLPAWGLPLGRPTLRFASAHSDWFYPPSAEKRSPRRPRLEGDE